MKKSNRDFLKIIGIYFLLWAATMNVTGYWPSLKGFGVSELFFHSLMTISYAIGTVALGAAIYSRQPKA